MTVYTRPLLSVEDMEELTGAKQPGRQIGWLRINKVGFTLDRLGRPKTTWGLIEKALSEGASTDDYEPPTKVAQVRPV